MEELLGTKLMTFTWKDKAIETLGDLSDAMLAAKTPEDAAEFLAAYSAVNEHARENVGYISGYYDIETAQRVRELFKVSHPIFGA